MTFQRAPVLLCVLFLAGCSGAWVRLPAGPRPEPTGARELQVWASDSLQLVRFLRVDGDSIRGIVTRSGDCQDCMMAMGLSDVDSVRSFHAATGGAESFLAGLGFGTAFVWLLLTRVIAIP